MKKTIIILFVYLLAPPGFAIAQQESYTVAVLGFEVKTAEGEQNLSKELTQFLDAELSGRERLSVVDRRELDKIISEFELSLSGTVSPATAAKIGELTGAQVFVSGRAFTAGKQRYLISRIVGVQTGRVFGETVTQKSSEEIGEGVQALALKVEKTLLSQADKLVAQGKEGVDEFEVLRARTKGKTLPAVAINIVETHRGVSLTDPAVETELEMILLDLGYPVVDPSKEEAEITISGEAFSEFALRKGNLISARARIELKARSESGRLIASDRETDVAVDLSESIAAKSALQKGARKIARRVLERVVNHSLKQ